MNALNQQDSNNLSTSVVVIDIPIVTEVVSKQQQFQETSDIATIEKKNNVKEKSFSKEDNKSAISKTSKSSQLSKSPIAILLKVPTCCGTVELTPVKICSLIGMALTIIAFVLLAGIIIDSYVIQQQQDLQIVVDRGDIKNLRDTLTHTTLIAIYAPDNNTALYYISFYNATFTTYLNALQRMMERYPEGFTTNWATGGNPNGTSVSVYERKALALVEEGKQKEAMTVLFTEEYISAYNNFTTNMDKVLNMILESEHSHRENMMAISFVGLIIISIALVILMPLMIGIFVLAINRDHFHLKKLKQANAIMLMDTMNDDKLREIFKKQCESEHSLENFTFLEKVTLYKRLCEQSYGIQEKLYGSDSGTNDTSSNAETNTTTGTTTDENNQNTKSVKLAKKNDKLEKQLKETEKKKYEMAFDIYTDFLDVNGGSAVNISHSFIEEVKAQLDYFNTGMNEILAEALFDNAAKEISIVMLDTHHRFKSSIAFQKQMKINKFVGKRKAK